MKLGEKVKITGHLRNVFEGMTLEDFYDNEHGGDVITVERFKVEEKTEEGFICGKRSLHFQKQIEDIQGDDYHEDFLKLEGFNYKEVYLVAVRLNVMRKVTVDLIKEQELVKQ